MPSGWKMRVSCVFLGVACISMVACGEEGTIPASADVALPSCDNEIGDMTQNLSKDGVRTAFLQADRACLWENADTIVVESFRLTVYQEGTGVEDAVVTGNRGVLNLTTQQMRANGSAVLFIPSQGRRIESEELYYDPQGNRMYSDSATFMYHEGRVLEGSGFTSDLAFENVTMRQFRTRPAGDAPPAGPPPRPGTPDEATEAESGEDASAQPDPVAPVPPGESGAEPSPGGNP
jgi:LPS export ABC transporter protein LptC